MKNSVFVNYFLNLMRTTLIVIIYIVYSIMKKQTIELFYFKFCPNGVKIKKMRIEKNN